MIREICELTLRNSGSSTFISVPLWSSSLPRWHRFSPSYKPEILMNE